MLSVLVVLLFITDWQHGIEYPAFLTTMFYHMHQTFIFTNVVAIFLTTFTLTLVLILVLLAYSDCCYIGWLEYKLGAFFMVVLHIMTSLHMPVILLLFEGIGLISFRLIGHYINRRAATRGGLIALLTNRWGDMMVLSIVTQILRSEWLNIDPLLAGIVIVSCSMKSIVAVSYVWLPDAMEGPTSVSALLHSATLVITGILISYHKVAVPSAPTLLGMFILGLLILIVTTDYDPDAKRVAAISTCTIVIIVWLGVICSSPLSWSWAQLHAGYKGTLFIGLTLFASTFSMQDLRTVLANPVTPYIGLLLTVVLFSLVIPSSDYDLVKGSIKLDIDFDWPFELATLVLKLTVMLSLTLYWCYGIALHLWNLAVLIALGPPGYSTYTGSTFPTLGILRLVLVGLASAAFTGILIYLTVTLYEYGLLHCHRLAAYATHALASLILRLPATIAVLSLYWYPSMTSLRVLPRSFLGPSILGTL